ncbi:hypothetical protein F5Y08DRAFT_130173 [Xylaria arbuscula]|nr:hypothetical protein F5Y08DRAFT_130173 [Xylaria arbuscula]
MMSATSLQLRALLAMPTALRPLLLGAFAPSRPPWVQSRLFSASPFQYRTPKSLNVAAFLVPEFRTSAISEITSDDLYKNLSLLSAADQPLEDELTKLYTHNPAAFIYAESNFYHLRKNTRVPEVCILGRSNVGKSSFVNALASRQSNALAYVSKKAGKTRSMNMYGFGRAPTTKELQAQGSQFKDEDLPTHTFHLVDMPGYGHKSLQEWGKNISHYLKKRQALKGAVLLIDAEVGPKDSDFHMLELLADAQVKTSIVMTKADKVRNGLKGLHETCTKVWDGIRAIEAKITYESKWTWEKEVYVTAVGSKNTDVARSTLTTARLAVAQLAGLVKDDRPKVERDTRWSGKVVSFEDLQLAPSKASDSETNGHDTENLSRPAEEMLASPKVMPELPKSSSGFAELEQAANEQTRGRTRPSARLSLQSRTRVHRAPARAFHTTSRRRGESALKPMTGAELDAVLKEFIKTLTADTPRDRVRRLQQERERHPPKIFRTSFKKLEERRIQKLQQQFPEQTELTRAVFERRLDIEERRRLAMDAWGEVENETEEPMTADWPVHNANGAGGNEAMDVNEFERAFAASEGLADDKKRRKGKK